MHPVICTIGPLTIYSYGLMTAIAVVISTALAAARAGQEDIKPEIIFNLSFVAVISGVIGARIFYIVENLGYYLQNPAETFMLQHGGLSWFGGLVLGGISAVIYLKNKGIPLLKTLDLIAPFIALAHAIGRIGCLLNGCCFGRESFQFGIYFPSQGKFLIPTQIYSSLALVLIFIFLRYLQDRPHKEGQIFFTYLLVYCFFRFIIEFWRAEHPIVLWGLTLFQLISIGVFIFSLSMLVSILRARK